MACILNCMSVSGLLACRYMYMYSPLSSIGRLFFNGADWAGAVVHMGGFA